MFKSIVTWPLLLAYIQNLKHKLNNGTIIQVAILDTALHLVIVSLP